MLKRSILFMDFAGEELGLLGSAEWVKEPTRPLAKAVAMINMERRPSKAGGSRQSPVVEDSTQTGAFERQ